MTSQASRYEFYPFPPTPTKESPRTRRPPASSGSTTTYSRSSSSSTTTEIMTPSPTAGKQQQDSAPKTPTKIARRAGQTPQKAPPKLGQSARKTDKLPSTPKPATTEQPESDEPLTPKISETKKSGDEAKQGSGPAQSGTDQADKKIAQATDDDDQQTEYDDDDDDEPLSKVTADKSADKELQQAEPEPIKDDEDENDAVEGASQQESQIADKAGQQVDDAGDADDTIEQAGQTGESTSKAIDKQKQQPQQKQERPQQRRGGSLLNGAKNLAGKASGLAGKSNGAAKKGSSTGSKATQDPKAAASDAKQSVKETADDAGQTASQGADDAKDAAKETSNDAGEAAEEAKDQVEDTVDGGKGQVKDAADDSKDQAEEAVNDGKDQAEEAADGTVDGVQDQVKDTASETEDQVEDTAGEAENQVEDVADDAEDQVEGVKDKGKGQVEDAADNAEDQVKGLKDKGKDQAKDVADEARDQAEDVADDAEDQVDDDAEDQVKDVADEGEDQAEGAVAEAHDHAEDAEDAADEAQDQVDDTADEAKDQASKPPIPEDLPLDLSVLKGLEVDSSGNIYDDNDHPIGKLTEGDAEDLAGYPIGDDGEILDDDGDLVGRCELLPEEIKRQLLAKRDEGEELPEGVDEYLGQLKEEGEERVDSAQEEEDGVEGEKEKDEAGEAMPGLEILDGLTCGVDGLIYDSEGNTVGQVTEGDPEELQHATLNDNGEFLDEEGNVVGRAELHEEVGELVEQGIYKAQDAADDGVEDAENAAEGAEDATEDPAPAEIEDQLPGIEALQGRELNEAGEVLDDQGNLLAEIEDEDLKQKIADGEIDPNTLTIDEQGQVLDEEGNVLSKTELVEGAAERLAGLLDFRILDGKRINKKGKIFDDDGEPIGELTDGELSDCIGQKANDKGEVFNKKGELVGHVRVVPGEAAQTATRELPAELGEGEDEGEEEGAEAEVPEEEEEQSPEEPAEKEEEDLSILSGLKVNKKGQVLNEDGEPIGELSSGDVKTCAGKKIDSSGQVLDSDGETVIGQVRTLSSSSPEDEEPENEEQQQQEEAEQDLSFLEGYKVNKKGLVLDEEGEVIAELSEGDPSECAGKKLNAQGEVLGKEEGEVLGTVKLVGEQQQQEAEQEEEDEDDGLPPLSTLEGLTVNKAGNILNSSGAIVGQLIEGDAKKISKSKLTADAEGQFWDNRGHVIGRAETVAREEDEEDEAIFAGLEGLRVVEEGFVQDANGHTVGYVTEGDAKKLIGRTVDEDGDVIDKKGTVVGHAERYEEEEEQQEEQQEEEEKPDLGFLQGKTVSKAGLVMGDEGIPIARLVEGNAKELAGKKLDEQGQIWNDGGKVVGRVELIPEEEREQKPEGPFAGLEDLRVIQGGKVADEDGNVVGEIVEGNKRRLVGLAVDEDGDIVDKYGNVKGRAEPLPEEQDVDYSVLDGMTLNKQGNVVDSNGVPYGKLVQGNAAELAGRQCDENGYIYNNTGKVVGQCEPLPEDERVAKPEGPFAGLTGLRVAKGGKVVNEDGEEIGEITEGDPKRLVGLTVDEDGDIIDKFGNTKGHAEPLVEEEQEAADNSILNNKTVNKQGYVVDEKGIPFGRLVEGNISELAGRKCDENGNIYGDTGKVAGRCEVLPENERVARPEGPFAGLEGLRVVKDGFVEDIDGNRVGQIAEGEPKRLVGLHVDEDGDIIDKYGNVKGHAEPWSEEEEQAADLSALAGTVINKAGYAVDGNGTVVGEVVEGNAKNMIGKKVDGQGQIWDDAGNIIGRCELVHGVGSPEGPFAGFEGLQIQKDGTITTQSGDIVGRVLEGDIKKLLGHTVDEDGDITDKHGNTIGKAERWSPDEKERRANPMSGKRVNKEGEVRDESGDLMGRLTLGDLGHCVGQEIDDAGNVVDVDGNKIGEVTLLENIAEEAEEEFEGPSEQELEEARIRESERQTAEKMLSICSSTLERMQPICSQISSALEHADRTPKDELDEEALVNEVQPLIEEGGRILQECNGSLRGLDPDGKIAAQAKGRAGTGEATPEEYRLAETLKELTTTVVKTVDDAKKKLRDMPHAKKKLNPLWGLLTQPLFQILAAVGLLLAGVLGLVGQLLNVLGLGGLVNGLLGGLGINKLLSGLGLGGGGGDGKKGKGKGGSKLGDIPVVGGLLGGK